jgi:hypothetical protein
VASDGSPDPALKVDADGQVGIGTPTPQDPLDVVGYIRCWYFKMVSALPQMRWYETDGADPNDYLQHVYRDNSYRISWRDDSAAITRSLMCFEGDTQNIGIGTITPAISAKLELSSTTGALLLTRMTTTQRNALTAVNGMLIYNSTLNKFQGREGGAWVSLI